MLGNASDIPQVVLNKAKSLNHNIDNFVILQDINTNEYYLPYGSKVNNNYSAHWRYTYYNSVYCLVTPGWGYTYMQAYIDGSFTSVSTNNVGSNSIIQLDMGSRHLKVVYASQSINYYNVTGHNNGDIYFDPTPDPFIENTDNSIETWTFDNLVINGGGRVGLSDNYFLRYTYPDNNTSYQFNINQYFDLSNGTVFFNIPRSRINEDIVIRPNTRIYFTLICQRNLEGGTSTEVYDLKGYNLTLTQEESTIINEDSDKQLLSDIKQEQQQTTQAVENLEDTITDTNISDDSIFFPTLDVPDLARDGLANIFDAFVLAFCSDTPKDIILPIPNTNKTITIPYNYIREMLTNHSPYLLEIITLFWWYWVARIIVFDIYNKMDKLQSGDVENLQKENITTNML